MFFTDAETQLTKLYLQQGHVIRPVADPDALRQLRDHFLRLIQDLIGVSPHTTPEVTLNLVHQRINGQSLNDFRLKIIQGINAIDDFRALYFRVARPYLEALVGNELAMQARVNLSIQLPEDHSSLLPVHADTWSGDSPFEAVVWLPLVDCYGTKAMYLLPPDKAAALDRNFSQLAGASGESLYQAISADVQWLQVRYGEVLVFNQALPHGNRVNVEPETRWSMNCRFKSVFTPYGDKKIGEFFEPITLRAASRTGMAYRLPKTS